MNEEVERIRWVLDQHRIREARFEDAIDALVDEREERYGDRRSGYVCGLTAIRMIAAQLFTEDQLEEAIGLLEKLAAMKGPEN